jgi:cysteine desulfurase family protein
MGEYFNRGGGNPGRSGHERSIGAARIVVETRELIAELFNIHDSSRIVITKNATEALNLAIMGLAAKGPSGSRGSSVVTTSMEHNSVMRPLTYLRERGIALKVVKGDERGSVDPEEIIRAIDENTSLVVVTHASNVTGTVMDVGRIGRACRTRGVALLVDAAQTAGVIPIDVEEMAIDFLAFSGHKGLLGPQGTGGLYIGGDELTEPLMRGGTGSLSDREEQPGFFPDRYESGTLNVIGLAGLRAGVGYVMLRGPESIVQHDARLLQIFLEGLQKDERFILYGPCSSSGGVTSGSEAERFRQTGVLSLNIVGMSPSKVGEILDRRYDIQTRIGLHCAPAAHRTIGTFPDGTVRLSWGVFNRERDARYSIKALREIAELGSA